MWRIRLRFIVLSLATERDMSEVACPITARRFRCVAREDNYAFKALQHRSRDSVRFGGMTLTVRKLTGSFWLSLSAPTLPFAYLEEHSFFRNGSFSSQS